MDSPEVPTLRPEEGGADENTPLVSSHGPEDYPPHFFLIELALCIFTFLHGFDATITASTYTVIGSEFGAVNTVSWITSSYMLTSTALQPLYGSFSNVFGRRACFTFASSVFAIGCAGCAAAPSMLVLNFMRALCGVGGGGLLTLAAIINSDICPARHGAMFQAILNILLIIGNVSGASVGGFITELFGWRWCFTGQVPIALLSAILGTLFVPNQANRSSENLRERISQLDMAGSFFLVAGLTFQMLGLTLGGNIRPWSDPLVISSIVVGTVLIIYFFFHEAHTKAMPILPIWLLRKRLAACIAISNVCTGMCARAFLFTLPLFYQVVLSESSADVGRRLVFFLAASPIGVFLCSVIMKRFNLHTSLVVCGTFFMAAGNIVVSFFDQSTEEWKLTSVLIPTGIGQGMAYTSILLVFLFAFENRDRATAATMVYLFQNFGHIWGIAGSCAIVQDVLQPALTKALANVPNKERIIETAIHSATDIQFFEPAVKAIVVQVYREAIRYAFWASSIAGTCAFLAAVAAGPA